jgi:hypothetical protein
VVGYVSKLDVIVKRKISAPLIHTHTHPKLKSTNPLYKLISSGPICIQEILKTVMSYSYVVSFFKVTEKKQNNMELQS